MIENIIASSTKTKIMRLFFEYPNRSFSTDELLKNSFSGRGYAGDCIKQFVDMKILEMSKVGREKRYTLNKNSQYYRALRELFDVEKDDFPTFSYIHKSLFAELIEALDEESIIVFGSVAAGTATPKSDIDVLFVTDREKLVRQVVSRLKKKYKVDIQPVILTINKLEELIRKGSSLMKEISKEKVMLRASENVKELISGG